MIEKELEKIMKGEGSLLKEVKDLMKVIPLLLFVDCEQEF